MPIYEYRCGDCQQVFEEWCKQVETLESTRNCPICNGTSQRIMSQTSFALKGEGWYVTEYGSRKKADAANTPAAPAAETAGAAAAEAAPQAGAAPKAEPAATPAAASTASSVA